MAARKVLSISLIIVIPVFLNYLASFILDNAKMSSRLHLYAGEIRNRSTGLIPQIHSREYNGDSDRHDRLIHVDVGNTHVDIPTQMENQTNVEITSPLMLQEESDGKKPEAKVSVLVSPKKEGSQKGWFATVWGKANVEWLASFFTALNGAWNFFTTIPINIIRFFLGWF
jgi:hypothetical protein